MGPGCGEVAGGGVSAGMWCVRYLIQVMMEGKNCLRQLCCSRFGRSSAAPGMDSQTAKKENYRDALYPKWTLAGVDTGLFCVVSCVYRYLNSSKLFYNIQSTKKNLMGYGAYVDIVRMNRTCSPVEPRYRAQKETSMPRDDWKPLQKWTCNLGLQREAYCVN